MEKYTLANEFGIIREEKVVSTLDVLAIDTSAGQTDGVKTKTIKFRLIQDVTRPQDLLITNSLKDVSTNDYFKIPVGSTIDTFAVTKTTSADLPSDLTFFLGYMNEDVQSADSKKFLATRVTGQKDEETYNSVTGDLLNKHKTIKFDQRLYSAQLAALTEVYDLEDGANTNDLPPAVNYDVVSGNTYVGEPRELIPAITVTAGTLLSDQLVFTVVYTLPAHCA